jgi:hypothetical protein
MELNLKGKRALVTGGSKGIGWACACALADEGCEVMIAARNPPAASRHKFRAADLSQRGAAEALAEWAGELDILVNNAGAIPGGDLLKVDEETWRRAWDLKVFGYINLTRQVYSRMKARKSGVIVNILQARSLMRATSPAARRMRASWPSRARSAAPRTPTASASSASIRGPWRPTG